MLAFKVLYAAQRSAGYSNATHGKRVSIRTFGEGSGSKYATQEIQ